ncbi:glycosyl transferase group 1 [Thermobaculum terrenum ATCC BAA-798]|uniref:Glycosyl transferase group 1 n=2 Tax=Thermobaculum TaxID=262406 RepID=D1CH62_THET1|nr:glycosyl transferase group 1 [Thermobaculum terrenum ATCC BAA-798]
MACHPNVNEFAVVGIEQSGIPGTTSLAFTSLSRWLDTQDVIWFEPAKPHLWKPAMLRASFGKTFPIVTLVHGIGYPNQLPAFIASLAALRQPTDTIIAPSNAVKKVFLSHWNNISSLIGIDTPPPNVHVIHYGVPCVHPIPKRIARASLMWDETPVIVFLGRLCSWDKADFNSLFEASAKLKAQGKMFKLLLAGYASSTDVKPLWLSATNYGLLDLLEIRPNISDVEKNLLLSGCDIFVSPSNTISESFGLSIVEAMLHAVPIVCTSWSGYREIVRDGVDGFLVDTYWNAPQAESMEEMFVMRGYTSFLRQRRSRYGSTSTLPRYAHRRREA